MDEKKTDKLCPLCNMVLDLEHFYRSATGYYLTYCKKCHNAMKKAKRLYKPTGPSRLPKEIQGDFADDMVANLPSPQIAKKYNINVRNVNRWKKRYNWAEKAQQYV